MEKKLILAPMATLSHEAFRRAVARFGGCDEYFTEMINASSLIAGGQWEKFYLLAGPEPEKIVWQLTGNKAESLAAAAQILSSLEGIGIDLNMGCSAPQIAQTGAGISWMTKPIEETRAMVRQVKKSAGKKRLSVKMRLGDENWTESNLIDFCRMIVDEGVSLLTIHGRTKKEKFRAKSRWEIVQKIALAFPQIPVILNGDICGKPSFEQSLKIAPNCAGVMIARAAAQKPWIFHSLRSNQKIKVDFEEIALKFIDDVEECQPIEFHKTRLQRFFAYFAQNMSFAHYFATELCNARNNDDSRNRVKSYFEKCPADKIKEV